MIGTVRPCHSQQKNAFHDKERERERDLDLDSVISCLTLNLNNLNTVQKGTELDQDRQLVLTYHSC